MSGAHGSSGWASTAEPPSGAPSSCEERPTTRAQAFSEERAERLSSADLGHDDLGVADLGDSDLGESDLGWADLGEPDLGLPDLGLSDLGTAPGEDAAVSADGGSGRFTDHGDGTVSDDVSGLVWQQGFSPSNQSQADSIAYCLGLALPGSGWRLPTSDELLSIVDLTVTAPTIDGRYFPGTPSVYFWSSSPVVGSPSNGWAVLFLYGWAAGIDQLILAPARCVR